MTDGRPVVLITGATGFVGRHLAPVLARDGWIVRRVVRNPSPDGNDVVIKSIGPDTDWSAAFRDVDTVVHLAAHVHRPPGESGDGLYRAVNTEGTLNLARCADKAGVRRFVFVSTILVHGRSSDGRAPFSEQDILTPLGPYGESKAAAEAGLKDLARASGMRITVIRPPLVYGSGAKGNFSTLLRAVRRGLPLPFASIDNCRAFLSVDNLASFVSMRLTDPDGEFEVFLLADPEQVSTPDFVRRLARAAGKKPLLFPMPVFLLKFLLTISGREQARDGLVGSLELDLSKLASTGWRPVVTMDEALRRAVMDPG
jgi:UDP-glucose 4-epimerase